MNANKSLKVTSSYRYESFLVLLVDVKSISMRFMNRMAHFHNFSNIELPILLNDMLSSNILMKPISTVATRTSAESFGSYSGGQAKVSSSSSLVEDSDSIVTPIIEEVDEDLINEVETNEDGRASDEKQQMNHEFKIEDTQQSMILN